MLAWASGRIPEYSSPKQDRASDGPLWILTRFPRSPHLQFQREHAAHPPALSRLGARNRRWGPAFPYDPVPATSRCEIFKDRIFRCLGVRQKIPENSCIGRRNDLVNRLDFRNFERVADAFLSSLCVGLCRCVSGRACLWQGRRCL